MSALAWGQAWRGLRRGWDRLAAYLPVILMGIVALATYLLARNTPVFLPAAAARDATHEPDYFLRDFTVRSFDVNGRLKSEVSGTEGRHYPDTDTLEIDQPTIRSYAKDGRMTVAQAGRAITNADGSEVQLFEQAVVVREALQAGVGKAPITLRSDFFHIRMNTEEIRTHLPVQLTRGDNDTFSADQMRYDNLARSLELTGRVRGVLMPTKRSK